MLAVVFLILFSAAIACAALVNRPSNVVALKGTRVELPCEVTKASYEFHWTFTPVGKSEVTIYSAGIGVNEKHAERMTVSETDRSRNLIINSARLGDAGTYACKVISTNGVYSVIKESGELIVLDGEPEYGTNLSSLYNSVTEGDFFQIYCNISFRGKWTPKMDCSQDGDNRTRMSEDASLSSSVTIQQSVTHTVTLVADRSKHNKLYSCRIFFSRELRVVGFTYNNVSYYTKSWTSPRVNITYAPKELLITPEKQIYNPGDRLTCSSDANPTPSIEWRELNAGRSVSGNSFPIKEYMTQEPISNLECIVRNSIGTTSKTISFSVEKASSESSSNSLTSITMTVGGILSLFFLAMLIMLIVYHIHIKRIVAGRKRTSNENSVNQLPSVEKHEEIQEGEGRDQSNPGDRTVDNRNEVADDDLNETYETMSETTYDELTPSDFAAQTTYSNLAIEERSPSLQFAESSHINSMTAEELDCDQKPRKHNYVNVPNAIGKTQQ